MNQNQWICCQLGAREHYAVARALAGTRQLGALITDFWMPWHSRWWPPGCPSSLEKLRERQHSALKEETVHSFNCRFLCFEIAHRMRGTEGWARIMARNRLFGRAVVRRLERMRSDTATTLFAYSYASLDIFRWAKARGWRTVLGQIDPGPVEVEIVREEVAREPELSGRWNEPPPEYWDAWSEECSLADSIVANSLWSQQALAKAGVPMKKLRIIPLAYETAGKLHPAKDYPARFTVERPLRVLFLGQINLRKGVARLLAAARRLRSEAVEFWMVGPVQICNSSLASEGARVRWIGPVSRGVAAEYYKRADVFILPTLSDGFALTQLEALAHRLPVIASSRCGDVVNDGVNGRILPSPAVEAIVAALRECLREPARLAAWSAAACPRPEFTLASVARQLTELTT